MNLNLDIQNYYEHLVTEAVKQRRLPERYDDEFLADLCCLVLTKLPARYFRHDVDMAYFLTSAERQVMDELVTSAIEQGLKQMLQNEPAE